MHESIATEQKDAEDEGKEVNEQVFQKKRTWNAFL